AAQRRRADPAAPPGPRPPPKDPRSPRARPPRRASPRRGRRAGWKEARPPASSRGRSDERGALAGRAPRSAQARSAIRLDERDRRNRVLAGRKRRIEDLLVAAVVV